MQCIYIHSLLVHCSRLALYDQANLLPDNANMCKHDSDKLGADQDRVHRRTCTVDDKLGPLHKNGNGGEGPHVHDGEDTHLHAHIISSTQVSSTPARVAAIPLRLTASRQSIPC